MTKTKRRGMAVTFGALVQWQRGVNAAMSEKRASGVPGMLLAIAIKNGGSVGELATVLATDIKTASRLLKGIRARGWATVEQDTRDERTRRVLLTEAGADVAALVHSASVDMATRILENTIGEQHVQFVPRRKQKIIRKV